MHKLNK